MLMLYITIDGAVSCGGMIGFASRILMVANAMLTALSTWVGGPVVLRGGCQTHAGHAWSYQSPTQGASTAVSARTIAMRKQQLVECSTHAWIHVSMVRIY